MRAERGPFFFGVWGTGETRILFYQSGLSDLSESDLPFLLPEYCDSTYVSHVFLWHSKKLNHRDADIMLIFHAVKSVP